MDGRTKAAKFRANRAIVAGWIGELYGLKELTRKLKDELSIEIDVDTLKKYIRREFGKGLRECQKEFSHAKENLTITQPLDQVDQESSGSDKISGDDSVNEKPADVQDAAEISNREGLKMALDSQSRNTSVAKYFTPGLKRKNLSNGGKQ